MEKGCPSWPIQLNRAFIWEKFDPFCLSQKRLRYLLMLWWFKTVLELIACASSDCLPLTKLTRLGEPKCLSGEKVSQTFNVCNHRFLTHKLYTAELMTTNLSLGSKVFVSNLISPPHAPKKLSNCTIPRMFPGSPQWCGRTIGRSVYGHVITKFSRMGSLPHFLIHGAPQARFARQSSAIKIYLIQ